MKITIEIDTERAHNSRVSLDGVDVSMALTGVDAHADLESARVQLTQHNKTDMLPVSDEARGKLAEFDALPEPA